MNRAMPATFTIAVDAPRHLIAITMSGFFLSEDVEAYAIALRKAHGLLTCPPNQHLTLADTVGMRIQTREVIEAFARQVRDPVLRSRRLAFVVGTSLARQQVRRLPDPEREGVGYFDDRSAAEEWLMQDAVSADRTVFRYRHAPALPTSGGHGCTGRSAA